MIESKEPFEREEPSSRFRRKNIPNSNVASVHEDKKYCKKEFDLKNGGHYLKKHISVVHEAESFLSPVHEPKKALKSKYCDSGFSQKQSLNRHIESVHKEKKPFKCIDCGKVFSQKHNMNRHIKLVHEGKKPFKCNICEKGFTQKVTLNGHIESVHQQNNPLK